VQIKYFSNFFSLCYRNGSFEFVFTKKKGLGPLGVKDPMGRLYDSIQCQEKNEQTNYSISW